MTRAILAVVAGLVVWMVVATLLNFGLRAGLAGYTLAEPTMTFTLGMKVARLILGALASLAAGAAAGLIAPSKTGPRWVLGRNYPGVVHSGAHSTLGEVPNLVSPGVFGNSVTACGDGRSAYKRALPPQPN